MSLAFVVVIAAIALLIGCASSVATVPAPTGQPSASVTSKPDWQRDWDEAVRQAGLEGKVTVYSSGTNPAMRKGLTEAFREKYGLELDFLVASASEISARLSKENSAGLSLADVMINGPDSTLTVNKPAGNLVPFSNILVLPEVVDPKAWWNCRLNYLDNDRYALAMMLGPWTIVLVNTDMVKAGDITSWNSLLEPRWKGKLLMYDPTSPGGGSEFFMSVAGLVTGVDYMRQLAQRQELFVTRDRQLQVEWVARGKYPIGLGASTSAAATFFDAGAPVSWWMPREKPILSPIGQCLALPRNPPHPNAAKVFVNALLTREMQIVASRTMSYQSARVDVPTDHLAPYQIRQSGTQYLIRDEDLILKGNEYRKLSAEIFGPLMK